MTGGLPTWSRSRRNTVLFVLAIRRFIWVRVAFLAREGLATESVYNPSSFRAWTSSERKVRSF